LSEIAMNRLAALLVLPALTLAACGDATQEPASAPATPPPAAETPVATPSPAPAGARAVALDPEGLRLVDRQSGSTAALAFGQPAEQVVASVSAAQGSAPSERGTNSECGAGALDYATWSDGLTLWFQNGTFAGWAVNEAGPTLMSGIGVGSSRADLEGAHVIQVEESTLGTEFASAGFYGILEAGRVSNLWAGVSCNFR
jgi:hypothetical protein